MATKTTAPAVAPTLVEDGNGTPLIESFTGTFNFVEDVATEPGKPKKVKVRGEFAKCDEATANKRVYPAQLWEREIKRLKESFTDRKVFGELDHPSDGRTMLNRVSHLVTGLTIEDGKVIGEAEILDTEAGRNLQALLKAGCKVGVSSRGYGSTKPNSKGEDVVQEDYKLATFDFVADPADNTAYPEVFFESKGKPMNLKDVTADVLKAEAPSVVESIQSEAVAAKDVEFEKRLAAEKEAVVEATKTSLKDQFSRDLLSAVATAKAEVTASVRAELMTDPAIAGAKVALESVREILKPFILPEDIAAHVADVTTKAQTEIDALKLSLSERDLKIKDLTDTNARLEGVAKEIGYSLFLERLLAGSTDGDVIRKMVGDVKAYSTSDDIKSKVEAIRAELARKTEEAAVETRAAKKKAVESETVAVESAKVYESEIEKLQRALEDSLAVNKATALELYIERRLTNHPKAAKIRSIMESANPASTEEVDDVIENFREPARDPDVLENVRARVRAASRGGRESRALDEEVSVKQSRTADYNGTGVSLDEMRNLAGIKK
jgi:hypothetical protein